jgi:Mn-dependent DtxR family transcriptional regulator
MPPRSSPSQSAEDYLERIHELIERKGYARVVDIATSLKVRRASVTSMVQKLAEEGYLQYEKYRGLLLTDAGRAVAKKIQSRHATLSRFFSLFDLDAEAQRLDIEGIEHHLSPATLEMLEDLARFFEEHPESLKAFRQSRRRAGRKSS